MASESPGRSASERRGCLENRRDPMAEPKGRGRRLHELTHTGRRVRSHRRGCTGSTETRTHRATGEARLVPGRKPLELGPSYNRGTGKSRARRAGGGGVPSKYPPAKPGALAVSRSKRPAETWPLRGHLSHPPGGYSGFNRSCSKRRSSRSWSWMYARIACSSRPTVDTKYPRAQKCCPTKFRGRPAKFRAM